MTRINGLVRSAVWLQVACLGFLLSSCGGGGLAPGAGFQHPESQGLVLFETRQDRLAYYEHNSMRFGKLDGAGAKLVSLVGPIEHLFGFEPEQNKPKKLFGESAPSSRYHLLPLEPGQYVIADSSSKGYWYRWTSCYYKESPVFEVKAGEVLALGTLMFSREISPTLAEKPLAGGLLTLDLTPEEIESSRELFGLESTVAVRPYQQKTISFDPATLLNSCAGS